MHGLAPPPLSGLINFKSTANRATRGAAGGGLHNPTQKKKLSVFSSRAAHQWIAVTQLPSPHLIILEQKLKLKAHWGPTVSTLMLYP